MLKEWEIDVLICVYCLDQTRSSFSTKLEPWASKTRAGEKPVLLPITFLLNVGSLTFGPVESFNFVTFSREQLMKYQPMLENGIRCIV